MTQYTQQTVGQLVAEKPCRARVFEKHRIDFCCGGKISLAEACEKRKVDMNQVIKELAACDASGSETAEIDWTKAPLGELAEHIISAHHDYLRSELPRIEKMAARVAKVHGDHAPEVIKIHSVFVPLRQELEEHTMKEEQILFPWIKRLATGDMTAMPFAATVAHPIRCMEDDHDEAGQALERIRQLSEDFNPPEDACNTWRVLYASLEALEQDMHIHIHKENSILFPRALEIEDSRKSSEATASNG